MSRLIILSEKEQREFDYPPILLPEARALCFNIPGDLERKINQLRTPTNQIGFLLQYGYFKASKRFFVNNKYHQEDIEYAAKILNISLDSVHFEKYVNKIPKDHREIILKMLDYTPFEEAEKTWVKYELQTKAEQLIEPEKSFFEILSLLHERKIEIPSYHRLADLVTKSYSSIEEQLSNIIHSLLEDTQKSLLDSLLQTDNKSIKGVINSYKIINQSMKPKAIQASINLFIQIKDVFISLLPVIEALKLTPQASQYYATWIIKAKSSQIKQLSSPGKKYLYLTAFIQHQYYLRQDAFVDIFLKCVRSAKNSCVKHLNKSDKISRNERRTAVKHLTQSRRTYKSLVDEIAEITHSSVFTDISKIKMINELLIKHESNISEKEQEKLKLFEQTLNSFVADNDNYYILEKQSIKLQRRVSDIVKILLFNETNSNQLLIKAISYFRTKDGIISDNSPKDFLSETDRNAILGDGNNSFNTSLYKILLFIYMSTELKSGDLNLKYSYRYLSIHDYLIDEDTWQKEREQLLKITELSAYDNADMMLYDLKILLDEKYHLVNQRYNNQLNPYLSINKNGIIQATTPTLEEKETEHISALLNQNRYVPILRVLSDIDNATNFSMSFKHHTIKSIKHRPKGSTFHAGIIALGCNIGVPKMAQISTGVNENTLNNTVNWYFTRKSLHDANQSIVNMIHQLSLSSIYLADKNQKHSASDGSKFGVAVDSLLANYSFKYFGKDKGISVYTFVDERQSLFHSLVMSASEREAAYVIDGLNNNDVPNIDIHSTDTHGYTESIFAATHFLDISFAPRLKKIGRQCIYAFSAKKTYENKGYKILPSRTINQDIIKTHWDDVLRFMVTIKLKKTPASQLFKRLSSYAKNNPLYKAIKEFGRIIKSLFILTYYDDVTLRQRIEKQLNRVEAANRFSRAIFYANAGEFMQGTSDNQETAVNCKMLIQNSIILWNYLYLSQLLTNCQDSSERDDMVNLIKDGSIINWSHINLHGEFNFKRHAANENPFNMDKILSLRINIAE